MVSLVSRRKLNGELAQEAVLLIEQELAGGRSIRAVALSTGIDRKTIGRIAAGEHVSQLLGSRYQRCPQGHLTILPCRTCAALVELDKKRSKRNFPA